MGKGRIVLLLIGLVVIAFVVLQILPVGGQLTNPPVTTQIAWDSPETERLVRLACYDCHSNETAWPWYAGIAPIRWLVTRDVLQGRDHMNFSTDSRYDVIGIADLVTSGEMPLPVYLLMHPEARLTEQQRAQLVAGIEATFGGRDD